MSEQTLDLRKSLWIAWRHKTIVGIVAALGLLIGAGFATLHPAMVTSKAISGASARALPIWRPKSSSPAAIQSCRVRCPALARE